MIKVTAACDRGCTASVCFLVNKKKQLEGDNGRGAGGEWSNSITLVTKHQASIIDTLHH